MLQFFFLFFSCVCRRCCFFHCQPYADVVIFQFFFIYFFFSFNDTSSLCNKYTLFIKTFINFTRVSKIGDDKERWTHVAHNIPFPFYILQQTFLITAKRHETQLCGKLRKEWTRHIHRTGKKKNSNLSSWKQTLSLVLFFFRCRRSPLKLESLQKKIKSKQLKK